MGSGHNGIAIGGTAFSFGSRISHNRTDENGRNCPVVGDLLQNCRNGIFVGRSTSGSGNRFEHNHARRNLGDGIRAFMDSAGNTYADNHMRHNVYHDAHDDNRRGDRWVNNHGETDFPPGSICGVSDPTP